MKSRNLLMVCLTALFAVSLFAQGDPVSGTWTGDWGPSERDRNPVTVQLKFDGKTGVTGTVNPGPNAIALKSGSFDPATGMIKLAADAKDRRGNALSYVIEGKVAGNTMTGSWNHTARKGDFKITKN
jgi:hypothetical protein